MSTCNPEFKINNLLVCLDLSDMDDALIRYTNYAVDTFKPESVTFMHVMDAYDIPDELTEALSGSPVPVEDLIRNELQEKVDDVYAKDKRIAPKVVLVSGIVTEKIIDYAGKSKIDLTLMGKKVGYAGESGVAKNIIGLIPSSVLLVTETTQPIINKIMVRTNFAQPSCVAFHMAQKIAEYTKASVEFHHVYKLPYNYFPEQSPETLKKMRRKMNPYMEKKFAKFIKKYDIPDDVSFQYSVDLQGDEAQSLYNYAIKTGVDMIVTGTRLKSQLANIIMDSTSAKLAGVEKNIPVLIVKDSKESVGFLTALFD
jgi:nucleotide-binding universal stress UspA family protein